MKRICLVIFMFCSLVIYGQTDTPLFATDGFINQVVQYGSKVFVAGDFNYVSHENKGIALFDGNHNLVRRNSNMVQRVIYSAYDQTTGNFYIYGEYKSNSGAVFTGVLKTDVNGNPVSTWLPKKVTGNVFCMELYGGKIYLGGQFYKIDTMSCNGLVVIDKTTGVATVPSSLVRKPVNTSIQSIKGCGPYVFITGDFDSIGGVAQKWVAKTDTANYAVLPYAITTPASQLLAIIKGNLIMQYTISPGKLLVRLCDTSAIPVMDSLPLIFQKSGYPYVKGIAERNDTVCVYGQFDSVQGFSRQNVFTCRLQTKAVCNAVYQMTDGYYNPSVATMEGDFLHVVYGWSTRAKVIRYNLSSGARDGDSIKTDGVISGFYIVNGKKIFGSFTSAESKFCKGFAVLDPKDSDSMLWPGL